MIFTNLRNNLRKTIALVLTSAKQPAHLYIYCATAEVSGGDRPTQQRVQQYVRNSAALIEARCDYCDTVPGRALND